MSESHELLPEIIAEAIVRRIGKRLTDYPDKCAILAEIHSRTSIYRRREQKRKEAKHNER